MLKYIAEFGKYLEIFGFRNAKIKDVEEFLRTARKDKLSNVQIQFFDAKFVATWQHLYFAVLNALLAFKNKQNISKSLAMETMLYASTQHQIRKATEIIGIKPNSQDVAVVVIGKEPEVLKLALLAVSKCIDAQKDDTVLEFTREKETLIQRTFGISDAELQTVIKKDDKESVLTDLVIERMALLATQH